MFPLFFFRMSTLPTNRASPRLQRVTFDVGINTARVQFPFEIQHPAATPVGRRLRRTSPRLPTAVEVRVLFLFGRIDNHLVRDPCGLRVATRLSRIRSPSVL